MGDQRLQVLHHQRRLRRLVHVYAKTDKDAGHRGISAFVVPKDDTVTVDKKEDKLGQRASNTATITFNETEIPEGTCSARRTTASSSR